MSTHELTDPSLEETGEVVIPGVTPHAIWQEHIERYRFAAAYTTGRAVLDIACGTGYGSAHLADTGAKSVTGGDISNRTLAYARRHFLSPRTDFVRIDAACFPFDGARFDVIVSFETIEHLRDPGSFVADCSRVLREGGLFVCSTPMRLSYRPPWFPAPVNPYHTTEYTIGDFCRLLRTSFEDVSLYGQRAFGPATVLRKYLEASAGRSLSGIPRLKAGLAQIVGPRAEAGETAGAALSPAVRPLRRPFPGFPSYLVALARPRR